MEVMTNREEDSFVSVEGFNQTNGLQIEEHQQQEQLVQQEQNSSQINQSAKRSLSPSAHDENSNSKRSHQETNNYSSSRRERSRSNDRRRRDRSRSRRRSRDRRESRRSDKPSRHSDKYKWERTCYVSNIPYDIRWTELKDLFREKCQLEPIYCEVYERDGKSLGVATIEFRSEGDAQKVVEKMHQYELGGRKISVRIDGEGFKTRQAREMTGESYLKNSNSSSTSNVNTDSAAAAALLASTLASSLTSAAGPNLLNLLGMANPVAPQPAIPSLNPSASQTHLLNQLASQLKVEGPVTNRLFVASLDYRVDERKIKEVFKLAGHVSSVSLFRDRDNRSRGMAVVEYDSPFEALNAVSMFNNQTLMDRKMTVRFDTKPSDEPSHRDKGSFSSQSQSNLPSGLKSIGNALGLNLLGAGGAAAPVTPNVTNNPLTLGALTALTGLGTGLNTGLSMSASDSFNSGLEIIYRNDFKINIHNLKKFKMSNDQNSKEKEIQNQDKHFAIDQVDPEIIRKWTQEQLENREKLKLYDTEPWQINRQVFDDLNEYPNYQNEKLRYVAGLDISFVKDEDTACSGLFVFDLKDNFKCVYKDLELIKMDQPYVPGFLAYREAPFLLKKLEKLKINKLNYYPHCIFIDGNGLLHGNKFGMACHIGYHSDTPTIGVSKQLFQVFGLEKNEDHKNRIKNELKKAGDCFELRSRLEGDNSLLGYCYRSTDQSSNPVYVSIGNKISWSTCLWILKLVVKKYRIPEPIRQADLLTRDFLKNL